jgi:nitrite reductase/ring-hydroxylating ferredoxin subunit
MIVNVVALGIMAASWAFRNWETFEPATAAVALEFGSIAVMTVGGWLGGTLVYRNQIGVDHRYAEAGKWQEQTVKVDADGYATVENTKNLEVDQMMLIHAKDRRIVLARTEDGFVAFDDFCTHKGGPLSDGAMVCGTVQCPWHGSQFDANDGSVQAGPAKKSITSYLVDESAGEVRIALSAKKTSSSVKG